MAVGEDVYCTLVMTDSYLPGAAVLAHSLRDSGTTKKLACLITLETLRYDTISELRALYDYVIPVDRIANPSPSNLYLIDRGDLLYAFTKIALWRQTQFRKIVYIDADVVALRAPDELFNTQSTFAAASDIGWPDIFNTGVMVLTPDMGTFWALQTLAASGDSFDGADQGLINQYYEHKKWERLPFTYNCTPSASYQYEPAYRYHKSKISMVHFIGQQKPWTKGRWASQTASGAYKELVSRWWAVFDTHYKTPTGSDQSGANAVRSLVRGEEQQQTQYYAPPQSVPSIKIEAPPTDPADRAEEIVHEHIEPTSMQEQRMFTAPQNEWDATRASPPADSRPEAANFPTQSYEFNADPTPFMPPSSYPEPPKNMWYEVPKEPTLPKEAPPTPIFPWEQRERTKPTRFFAEDLPPAAPSPERSPDRSAEKAFTAKSQSSTPTLKLNDEHPPTIDPTPRNAWDDHAGISEYVRQLSQWQKLRGKVQVLSQVPHMSQSPNVEASDPLAAAAAAAAASGERRSSLVVTDFPTPIERPSLPVTPAPIRRNLFWGPERDAQGVLPPAEGVPDQADWNPSESLERLRVSSLSLDPSTFHIPAKTHARRDMPASSSDFIGSSPGSSGAVSPAAQSPGASSHVHFLDEVVSGSSSPVKGTVRFSADEPIKNGSNGA